jgi:hypothetical protein
MNIQINAAKGRDHEKDHEPKGAFAGIPLPFTLVVYIVSRHLLHTFRGRYAE